MNKYLQYIISFFCKKNINEKIIYENYKILKKYIKDDELIPYFSFKNKIFYGTPCNIYDGDTFSIIFNYKGEFIKYRCRCLGYDSPEMKPSLKNENRLHEKELALKAKNRFIELI